MYIRSGIGMGTVEETGSLQLTNAGQAVGEIREGKRFPFGANWASFLTEFDQGRVEGSKAALQGMLGAADLVGKTLLDVGCGSGIHSLAARLLNAQVVSFDFDPLAVACTLSLQKELVSDEPRWQVLEGSALDREFLKRLGSFDIVYSWGVLHHTGAMWASIDNVTRCVARGGVLFIAIYNDQGWLSHYWRAVKRLYNQNALLRWSMIAVHLPYLVLARWISRSIRGRLRLDRGMSYWSDAKDWLGGFPFEVARPEKVTEFLRQRGFILKKLKTCGRRPGCNEFVFSKQADDSSGKANAFGELPAATAPTVSSR